MIWANVTKFGQNVIAPPQIFLGWYGYDSGSTASSVSDVMATDLPSELTAVQMVDPQTFIDDTAKTDKDFNAIDLERQIQEPELQNDVGLWENITNAVQEH